MAKLNDMPELNSAKVFSTILLIKEYLKPPWYQPLLRPIQGALPPFKDNLLPAQPRNRFNNGLRQAKNQSLTVPGYLGLAVALPENGDMNGCTVDGLKCNGNCPKDERADFTKTISGHLS